MERRTAWIDRPLVDIAVAASWVPLAVAARLVEANPRLLTSLLAATLLLSLAHQPLTLALVYGDPAQFGLRRKLFTWSPLVFLVAVLAGRHMSLLLVAVVAGLWNAEHTLMQRYGLTRIYGRKVGQEDGGVERAMLLSWLAVALLWTAADPRTPGRATGLGLGATNEAAVRALASLRPWALLALVPLSVGALGIVAHWWRIERQRLVVNRAKHVYLACTAGLFATMLWDPLVGLVAYVGAHAVEYLVTVHRHLGRRYGDSTDGGALGRAVRSRAGRSGVIGAYLVVTAAALTALRRYGSVEVYTTVYLTVGGLHVFYDGVIWKLRRPWVAKGFALSASSA